MTLVWFVIWLVANNVGAHEPLEAAPLNAWTATLILGGCPRPQQAVDDRSEALRRPIRVRDDGRFSARFRQASSLNGQTSGDVRIRGRVRRRFARGTLRVARMFEGCESRQVRWMAAP